MSGQKISKNINMLEDPLLSGILFFALPVIAGSILQQLFNAVDVAVVGRFASSEALAAVGANTSVVTLFLNLFIGISVGSNVVIARYIGLGERDKVTDVVHTSVVVALISGFLLLGMAFILARPLLALMSTPDNVLDQAVLYLRLYALGMPAIMVYNFGAAILRSIGDTRRPLYCLILSGVLNAVLNLIFVVVLSMGVAGVAIATTLANYVSAGIVLYILLTEDSLVRLIPARLKVHKKELVSMLRIGIPAGLQGMVFSFANVCIQTAINSFGSDAVAGSAAAVTYEFICYFVINGFNQAAVTFVSQNYGAGRGDRCRKAWILCLVSAMAGCAFLNISINIFGSFFIHIFTTDPAVVHYGMIRLRYILLFQAMAASYEVTGSALRGYGYSLTPALLTVLGTCLLRLLWIALVHTRYHSFEMLMLVYPFSWIVTGSLVIGAYFIISRKIHMSQD